MSRASHPVKQKPQKSLRATQQPKPPTAPPTTEEHAHGVPFGEMLAAFTLADLYKSACTLPFTSACSHLEGVYRLMRHHPDFKEQVAALFWIVTGEGALVCLRDELAGSDAAELDAALEEPLASTAERLGICLRRLVDAGKAAQRHLEAHARIVAGLGTLERLRAYLDAL